MIRSIQWSPGLTLHMDPNAVLDYTMDFTDWLDGGTLASVTATEIKCTTGSVTLVGNVAKVRVSAVAFGASVTLRPTAADSQADDFTLNFTPRQK